MTEIDDAAALLASLQALGATVTLDGDAVRVRARPGVLDTTLRTAIGSHKAGLVVLLTGDPPTAAAPPAERVKLDCHDPWAGGGPGIDEQQLAETVRNALAAAPADRAGWRREIVHALVWAEAGRWRDPHLALDLAALRTLVPPGACLACDGPCSADGRRWCDGCAARHAAAMGGAA